MHYHKSAPKIEVRNPKYIDFYIRENSTREAREKAMNAWYREQLKKRIPTLLKKWEAQMAVEVKDWSIRKMKTKWGTCTPEAQRILLNLELAKKPLYCLEYILVHEMVHLLVRHHNEQFIAYMDKFLPTWRTTKAELNRSLLGFVEWG